MNAVLILDAEQRAALAVARSLANRGLRVEVASASRDPLAASARGVVASHYAPSAEQSAESFLDWLRSQESMPVMPVTDTSTMLVHMHRESADSGYGRVSDKASLLELAALKGVPIPTGHIVESVPAALNAASRIGYPVIVKPARSKALLDGRVVTTGVGLSRNAENLSRLLESSPWFPRLPVIVQQYVPGHGAGVFCLFDRDHSLAWFAHRRLREKPPSGGVSVLCESVPVDPILKHHAETLLRAAGYRGVAMVEFRIGDNGHPYLMEINARFWGSIQLAIDCGVDFPWLYYLLMQGQSVPVVTDYSVGRRLRWLLGDLDNLLIQLRDPLIGGTTKLKAMTSFGGTFFDARCWQEVFRWSDPAPALRETRQWIRNLVGDESPRSRKSGCEAS
jgi:predicted ATP-grasp superfamily ATP-dependent carboligase